MISFKFLNNAIDIKDGVFSVLVIENKKLFRNVICSLENDFEEDYFTFSIDFKPVQFSKCGMFISNVLNVDLGSKKLISKITAYMENVANDEYAEQVSKAKKDLLSLAELIVAFSDFDCEYNCDIETADIVKILQFKVGTAENTPEELLIMYIKLIAKYLKINFFVIPNLHLVFSEEELKMIYDELLINHINIISLECFEPKYKFNYEEYYALDNDLCEIDKEII